MSHWTERSAAAFAHSLLAHLERVFDLNEVPRTDKLTQVIRWARVKQMKVALLVYDDGDGHNYKGPIPAEVFLQCWEKCGKPKDFFDLGPGS